MSSSLNWIGKTLSDGIRFRSGVRGLSIQLKSQREISLMREAGLLVAQALDKVRQNIRPGVTTAELDHIVSDHFKQFKAIPLFKGVPSSLKGKPSFPASICASVNEQVVHGIPGSRVLKDGDIIAVDTGCSLNGWCGDSAFTFAVGNISEEKKRLLEVTEKSLAIAIERMKTANTWSEVAHDMEVFVRSNGMSVIEQFVGHGIGKSMHEDPQVPNYVSDGLRKNDFRLEPGLVLAIEPMVALGTKNVRVLPDGWTVETTDRRASAHFEHTVAMTEHGPKILTLLQES